MKSLILKDFYLMKSLSKSFIVGLFFFVLILISNYFKFEDSYFIQNIFGSIILFLIFSSSYYSFYYDDENKFLDCIRAMPISLREYVKGKYIFSFFVFFVIFVLLFVLNFLKSDISTSLYISIVQTGILSLAGMLIIMLIFKYGVKNIIQIIYFVYFGFVVIYTINNMKGFVEFDISKVFKNVDIYIVLAVVVLNIIFYVFAEKISVKILENNRE